jgi:hypothetical protein
MAVKKNKVGRPKKMGRPLLRTTRMKGQVIEKLLELQEEEGSKRQITLQRLCEAGKWKISKRTVRRILAEECDFLPLKETIVLTQEQKDGRKAWCEEMLEMAKSKNRPTLSWIDEHTVPKMRSIRTKEEHERQGITGQYVPKGVRRESKPYYCKRKRTLAYNFGGQFKYCFYHKGSTIEAYPLTWSKKKKPFNSAMMRKVFLWLKGLQGPDEMTVLDNDPRHVSAFEELPVKDRPKVIWQKTYSPDFNSLDFSLNHKIDIQCRREIKVKRMGQAEYESEVKKIVETSKELKTAAKKAASIVAWRKRLKKIAASGGELCD